MLKEYINKKAFNILQLIETYNLFKKIYIYIYIFFFFKIISNNHTKI